jgi:hypothetical protein
MTIADQWAFTAYHEVGHVIGYLHFGWRFGQVRIWQAESGSVRGTVTSPAGRYTIICMAGPIADEVLTGVDLEEPGSHGDIRMAREALARVGSTDIASLVPLVRALVSYNWPTVEFVASLLMGSGTLEYEQLVRLLRKELVRRGIRWRTS